MNISGKKIIVLSLIAGFVTSAIPASAFTRIAKGSETMGRAGVEELADKELAVLSNNPLYFFKVWGNNIVELFISDEFQEASFDLKKAGELAGEVRKLADIAPDDTELLSTSLKRYEEALDAFKTQLFTLTKEDVGADADQEITGILRRLFTQLRFVDDVRDTFSSHQDMVTLAAIDETLVSSLRFIALNLDTPDAFSARVTSIVIENSDAATAVRVIRILAKLVQEASGTQEANAFVSVIANARGALILDFADAMREESSVFSKRAAPAVAAFSVSDETRVPTIAEIVDQLADDTLKAELSALLQ